MSTLPRRIFTVQQVSPLLLAIGMMLVAGCSQNNTIDRASLSAPAESATTVYVVRHAEKEDGRDPALTVQGKRRAKALAAMLGDDDIAAVFATEYLRTRQTVEPLAMALGMEVEVSAAGKPEELAQRILREFSGAAVVAAAHSNTVPRILTALGVRETVEISDKEYGDLFVVEVRADGSVELTRHRFGG